MSPTVEGVLLLLAWAATFGLFVLLPWVVVRVVVGLLEADVGRFVTDHLPVAHDRTEPQAATTTPDDEDHRPDEPGPDGPGPI